MTFAAVCGMNAPTSAGFKLHHEGPEQSSGDMQDGTRAQSTEVASKEVDNKKSRCDGRRGSHIDTSAEDSPLFRCGLMRVCVM